ncbi:hypothetical protein BRC19_00635 [Candidatus Saccharibacteria bacterium QS_5_54_17]|nr:MAG: hypothetical protein BRC19_00635 [Candidatus Saccharibacteria bacterium QS_5_54_17]
MLGVAIGLSTPEQAWAQSDQSSGSVEGEWIDNAHIKIKGNLYLYGSNNEEDSGDQFYFQKSEGEKFNKEFEDAAPWDRDHPDNCVDYIHGDSFGQYPHFNKKTTTETATLTIRDHKDGEDVCYTEKKDVNLDPEDANPEDANIVFRQFGEGDKKEIKPVHNDAFSKPGDIDDYDVKDTISLEGYKSYQFLGTYRIDKDYSKHNEGDGERYANTKGGKDCKSELIKQSKGDDKVDATIKHYDNSFELTPTCESKEFNGLRVVNEFDNVKAGETPAYNKEDLDEPGVDAGNDDEGDDEGSDDNIDCDAGFGLSWLVCNIISAFRNFMEFATNVLESLLSVSPLERTNDEGGKTFIYQTWSSVRNMANIFLIPVFIFLIYAQATSFNIDTYTIKKMLPRLVAAVIFIQASFFLVAIAVDITNVLGKGIEGVVLAPIQDSALQESVAQDRPDLNFSGEGETSVIVAGSAFLTYFAATGGLATIAGGAVAFFLVMLPAIIAIIATFLTLMLRLIIIVLLTVLSPIAFLLWVLPNTEKWFKQWLDMLLKALMMFPLIMLLLASGTLVAVIATNFGEGDATEVEDAVTALIGFVAVMAPLFVIPFTYKLAGGAVSVLGGTVSNLTNKAARGKDGKGGKGGKGGLMGGLQEKKERRETEMAAGMKPDNLLGRAVMGTPAVRKAAQAGARPGVGVGGKSQAQAIGKFKQQVGEADRTLEEEGINDPEIQNEIAQHGDSIRGRIKELEGNGETEKAEKLKEVKHHSGKKEVRAAALQRVAKQGKAQQASFDEVQKATGGQVGKDIVSQAAQAAGKDGGRPDLKAYNTASNDEDKWKNYKQELRSMSTENWQKLKPDALEDKNNNPTEFAQAARQQAAEDKEFKQMLGKMASQESGVPKETRDKLSRTAGLDFERDPDLQAGNLGVDVASAGGTPVKPREGEEGTVPTSPRFGQSGQSGGPQEPGGAGEPGQPGPNYNNQDQNSGNPNPNDSYNPNPNDPYDTLS